MAILIILCQPLGFDIFILIINGVCEILGIYEVMAME